MGEPIVVGGDAACENSPAPQDVLKQLKKEQSELQDKAMKACLEEVQAVLDKYGMTLQVVQNVLVRPK